MQKTIKNSKMINKKQFLEYILNPLFSLKKLHLIWDNQTTHLH
jgi:hypothetical protein